MLLFMLLALIIPKRFVDQNPGGTVLIRFSRITDSSFTKTIIKTDFFH